MHVIVFNLSQLKLCSSHRYSTFLDLPYSGIELTSKHFIRIILREFSTGYYYINVYTVNGSTAMNSRDDLLQPLSH